MDAKKCKASHCHWFDGTFCHRDKTGYVGTEPEYVGKCVPETYDEYEEHCRKMAGFAQLSCKSCKHRIKYIAEGRSYYYCDILMYDKKGKVRPLGNALTMCHYDKWEPKIIGYEEDN